VTPARVLMTADAVGGVWRYAVDIGAELSRRGVQVVLAVMGPAPTPAHVAEAHAASLALVHRPYRLEWMDEPWDDVEGASDWLLGLERQFAPTLIHLNGYAHAALPWRAPVVVVAHSCVRTWWRAVHGVEAPSRLDRYTGAVASGLAAAHVVVAPTAAMGASLQAEYGARLTIRVIPNGYRPAVTAAAPATAKREMVLAAGRVWDEAKNIRSLCRAAGSISWPVYIAGERRGPDGTDPGWRGVQLLGPLAPSVVRQWYQQAAIYALPARYEPFGLSILEAAAAGCALVLGDIPSLRENWDGAAVFVDPDDADGIATALRRLIARTQTREDLGRRAQDRAAELTIDRTADGYCHLYEALIA
jgi:glycogen(starch) synthase